MMHRPLFALLPLLLALTACESMPTWLGGEGKKHVERVPGERVSVLRGTAPPEADATLAAQAYALPDTEANTAWAQHSTPVRNAALPAQLREREHASIGKGKDFSYRLVTAPVVADDGVFAMDAAGRISAHMLRDISQVAWVSPGVATDDGDAILGGGLAYDAQRLFASSGKGLVAAFNPATGAELWRQSLGIPIRSAPRVEDGRVYVVTVDSQLYALDAATGGVLWSHRGINEGKGFLTEGVPASAGELVVAPYSSGEVHVLHADDGGDVWSDAVVGPQRQAAISVFTGIGGDPVVADGVVYVAGSAGMFAAFQLENGRRLWDQPISSVNTPWVAGDLLFILTTDSQVLALSRLDGRVRWVQQLPVYINETTKKERYSWNGPVMAGGRLLIVGAHGEMRELSPSDGSAIATTSIPSGIYTAPVAAGGKLFLVAEDATLYALY